VFLPTTTTAKRAHPPVLCVSERVSADVIKRDFQSTLLSSNKK
jgi:hypothetical protein